MGKFIININGKVTDESEAKLSVLDRGFLYGDSVYEATRTFNKIPLRLNQHIERLFSSAHKIYFIPQLTSEQIKSEVLKVINQAPYENINLRIVLTRGTNSDLGLNPDLAVSENLIIYAKELTANPDWWYQAGVSLTTYQKESSSKGSLPKTGNYIENMLAYRQALTQNFYDSIMINNDGNITECTTSNIWMVKNGVIYTPHLNDGVLPGLTRATLLAMKPNLIKETQLTLPELLAAEECFITSTTREIVPVTRINDKIIGNGKPGSVTLSLLDDYRKHIILELHANN
jgi:branched-chain amino acid aminotransferase